MEIMFKNQFYTLFFYLLLPGIGFAQSVKTSNIWHRIIDDKIEVFYDLPKNNDSLNVKVVLYKKSDAKFIYHPNSKFLSGAVGIGKYSGEKNKIVWAFKNEPPEVVTGGGFYFEVIASKIPKRLIVKGFVVEDSTQKILKGVTVTLRNRINNREETFITEDDGFYSFKFNCDSAYAIEGRMENASTDTKYINIKCSSKDTVIQLYLGLTKGVIKNKIYTIGNIHFNDNKWMILPNFKDSLNQAVWFMKENPEIKIEIGSHTDSRGNDDQNMRLSQKRAQAVFDYLVSQGIDKSRLRAIGYGETKPVNRCENGIKCSEEEYQINNRIEFKLVEKF
jgi:outer membrane protein OmpA-like peptidoglycan-associated protein